MLLTRAVTRLAPDIREVWRSREIPEPLLAVQSGDVADDAIGILAMPLGT
jgi:hypothetical protein